MCFQNWHKQIKQLSNYSSLHAQALFECIKNFKHIFLENRVPFEIFELNLYTIVPFMMSVEAYDTQSAFRVLQGISKSINFSTAGNVPRFTYE